MKVCNIFCWREVEKRKKRKKENKIKREEKYLIL
jgi:hypothetical protein